MIRNWLANVTRRSPSVIRRSLMANISLPTAVDDDRYSNEYLHRSVRLFPLLYATASHRPTGPHRSASHRILRIRRTPLLLMLNADSEDVIDALSRCGRPPHAADDTCTASPLHLINRDNDAGGGGNMSGQPTGRAGGRVGSDSHAVHKLPTEISRCSRHQFALD